MAAVDIRRLLLLVVVLIGCIEAKSLHHKKQHHGNNPAHDSVVKGDARSYIDIDASDPFKVPKSSQYIDQPVPEYSFHGNQGNHGDDEEDNEPPPKGFDNIQEDLKHLGLDRFNRFKERRFREEPRNEEGERGFNEQQPMEGREQENNEGNRQTEEQQFKPEEGGQ